MELHDETTLIEQLRSAGLKATPQRLAIFRIILEARDHPTPEKVHSRLREQFPSFTVGTIYRTLETLSQVGLIAEVLHIGTGKRYDGNMDPHHHLVCKICQQIFDLPGEQIVHPKVQGDLNGFTPQEFQVQVLGVCAACKN